MEEVIVFFNKIKEFLQYFSVSFGSVDISLFSLIKGLLFFTFFIWIAKKLSILSERQLVSRIEMNNSSKVLISKIIKIILYTLAITVTLGSVGIDLTAFAVLSGAIGVGIGFGLQKVVSNIISGFILLMDESLKPGDIIEVGSTYGTVTSVGFRYVSIKTLSGREHLIPNEEFVINRVINWTHSDKLVSVSIPIGISYKSDLELAMKIMEEEGAKHPRVIKTNPPKCFLTSFGDSSINLELIIWIDDPEKGLMGLKSDIYLSVWKKFKENNIEIPFPQREVLIKKES